MFRTDYHAGQIFIPHRPCKLVSSRVDIITVFSSLLFLPLFLYVHAFSASLTSSLFPFLFSFLLRPFLILSSPLLPCHLHSPSVLSSALLYSLLLQNSLLFAQLFLYLRNGV